MSVMQEPVQDGIGDRGVADPAMPVFDGELCGDDGGVPFGTVVHDLQQIFPTVGFQWLQGPVIED